MIRAEAAFAFPSRVADAKRNARRKLMIRLLLLVAILAAFGRTLGNDFVDWDDRSLIYLNKSLNPPTLGGLAHHWNPHFAGNVGMYDPIVFTTWWFVAQGAQLGEPDMLGATLNPILFHGANLLVHWLAACLVLEILLELGLSPWPAALGTLFFAIHPLQTEAVAWATGMKDLLSGFLALAAIWVYLISRKSPLHEQRKRFWLATVLYILALLAKPSVVVLPAILWVLDVVIYHRPWKKSAWWLSIWLVPAFAAFKIAKSIQPTHLVQSTPLWTRPLVAMDSLAFYLWKLVLPARLNFDYGRTPSALLNDPDLHHALYWTWIFPLVLAILIYKSRGKELIAAGLIFLLGVLPVLGLTPFIFQFYSTVADRYVYLSMLGVALAAGWLIQQYNKQIVIGVACVLLTVLCGLSFAQVRVWKDSESLYQRGITLNPHNANHYIVLGIYRDTQSDMALRRAKMDAAQGAPLESLSQNNLARDYLEKAIVCFREVIRLQTKSPEIYDRLSFDLILLGRMNEAIAVIHQLINLQPSLPVQMRAQPAALHFELGMALGKAGRYADAQAEMEQSLQLKWDQQVADHLAEIRKKMAAASKPATTAS